MANKKIKFPLWLMPETKATVECLYRQDGCNSQSEFIEKAILFYCGYLQSEYAGDFLPKILGETLEAILSMFGDRIGKLLLKQAVEQNVCNHILASDTDIDAQTYGVHHRALPAASRRRRCCPRPRRRLCRNGARLRAE